MTSHLSVDHDAGYWGPTDALVDWCEANYAVTQFIAEFYNTVSSFPLILLSVIAVAVGVMGKRLEMRFLVTFLSLGFVGVGSALFHATMRYWGQLFDEVPMMLGSLSLLYCIYTTDLSPKQSHWRISTMFISWGLLNVYLYIFQQQYALFLINYGGQTLISVIFGYTKCRPFSTPLSNKLFFCCVGIYAMGLSCWIIDQRWCSLMQPFQLHAFWHICAGYGSYLGVYCSVICRGQFLKYATKLKICRMCSTVPIAHYIIYVDKVKD